MRRYIDLQDEDLVNLIYVASKAEKNKTSLIKARYHMFVRALEGAFITLNSNRKLYLTRQNYAEIDGDIWKVFEAAVCDDCGRIGVAGKTVNNRLESSRHIHHHLRRQRAIDGTLLAKDSYCYDSM